MVCFYRAAGVWPANGATNRRYLCHYLLKVPIVLLLVLLRCSPRKIVQYRYLVYLQSRSSRGFSPPAPSHSLIRHPTARWRIENELRRIFKLHKSLLNSSICTSLRLKTIQFWPATGVAKSGRWNHFSTHPSFGGFYGTKIFFLWENICLSICVSGYIGIKMFFSGKIVFRYLFTANQDVLSHFFIPIFFLLFCCVYIFIFCLRHFGIHENSIMNRIYCFAPSIRVAPSFYIFDLKKCNTYLPT